MELPRNSLTVRTLKFNDSSQEPKTKVIFIFHFQFSILNSKYGQTKNDLRLHRLRF